MKNQELTVNKNNSSMILQDIQDVQQMCNLLMKTPHYEKIGLEGVFAVVEKARSLGVEPMAALNGGMYYFKGKVEMSAAMMNQLIRGGKHSITKDRKSNDTICILHGKRADNGDTWTEAFSIAEAERAGIYVGVWLKYPRDMLFARALSRLARQLFPDVIQGCYVVGEISDAPPLDGPVVEYVNEEVTEVIVHIDTITEDEAKDLDELIGYDVDYRKCVMKFIEKEFQAKKLSEMPRNIYDKILPVATRKHEERKIVSLGIVNTE